MYLNLLSNTYFWVKKKLCPWALNLAVYFTISRMVKKKKYMGCELWHWTNVGLASNSSSNGCVTLNRGSFILWKIKTYFAVKIKANGRRADHLGKFVLSVNCCFISQETFNFHQKERFNQKDRNNNASWLGDYSTYFMISNVTYIEINT